MKSFKVTVQKNYYQVGSIVVSAMDEESAVEQVLANMRDGTLQSNAKEISWDDLQYEDGSFDVDGDVEEVSTSDQTTTEAPSATKEQIIAYLTDSANYLRASFARFLSRHPKLRKEWEDDYLSEDIYLQIEDALSQKEKLRAEDWIHPNDWQHFVDYFLSQDTSANRLLYCDPCETVTMHERKFYDGIESMDCSICGSSPQSKK